VVVAAGVQSPQHNVPARPTPLIGRNAALADALRRLLADDVRLLTLTGPGGTGKTRLAVEIAASTLDRFADGVWFVDLSPVSDARLVPSAIARTLGVETSGDTHVLRLLTDELSTAELLLVLDNFEQVLGAAADIAALLGACPRVKILVTSRAPLDVAWEHVLPVSPLAQPDAVALFVDRARAARGEFHLDDDNQTAVSEICARVDGLPLAIELAAARSRILPPSALLSRLQRRLDVLRSSRPDVPARHHTMAGTIDWSYALLPPEERALFRRLGVFVGGCGLDAVEAIAPDEDVLEALGSLVNKSLLRVDDTASEARYRMLETLREFALARLQEADEEHSARSAQALFLRALVEQAEPELRGAQQSHWLDRLEREHDNLRAALGWAIEHDLDTALRLSGGLWRFWFTRGFMVEGQEWLEAALERGAADARVPLRVRARALTAAGEMAWGCGDIDRAGRYHRASLPLRRELGDMEGTAQALHNLGNLAIERGELAEAQALHEEALELRRGLGNKRDLSLSLKNLGRLAVTLGHVAVGRAMLEESLDLAHQVGGNLTVNGPLHELGTLALMEGNIDAAAEHYAECLRLATEIGAQVTVARAIETAAIVSHARADLVMAARLLGAGEALREAIRSPQVPTESAPCQPAITAAQTHLGPEGFRRAWEEGRGWTTAEAVAVATAALREVKPSGSPAARHSHPAGLSSRELEVVELIARGLTNRQIADRLVISERTAHAHVRNILDKLGCASRVEVATWATQNGLGRPE
jgi:predicted ATPase/DNA-binding CsgD family transcriptional regulator